MKLNDRQRYILARVLEEQIRLTNLPEQHISRGSSKELGRRRILIQQARDGLVPISLAGLLGRSPSASEFVLYNREYGRLEEMDLLERCNPSGGRRSTHLRLTPQGRQVAEGLLGMDVEDDEDDVEPFDVTKIEFLPVEVPPEDAAC